MPTTPIAALLYVFLLIPGVLFLNRVESHRARRARSVFRETAIVVVASVSCAALFLLIYLALSLVFPPLGRALGEFIHDPGTATFLHPRLVFAAALVFLFTTVAFAWAAGSSRACRIGTALLWGRNRRVVDTSAWNQVMEDEGTKEVVVGVQLKSGTWVQGVHLHHTDVEEDTGDRALVLQGSIQYRGPDEAELQNFETFDRLVVQASEIDYLLTFQRQPAD